MRYDVKDPSVLEQEAQERQAKYGVWPKGKYDFEILTAAETTSKNSGKQMIALDIRVFNDEGHTKDLKDYIVESQPDKLYALCKSIGKDRLYLSGNIDPTDLVGAGGKCGVGIETGEYNGEKTQKNKIGFYLPRRDVPSAFMAKAGMSAASPTASPPSYMDGLDDPDIPF